MSTKKDVFKNGKIEPIKTENLGGVFVSLTLDTRHAKKANEYSIAVRVTFLRKQWYFLTGKTSTFENYPDIVKAKNSGENYKLKNYLITDYFDKVAEVIKELNKDVFTLEKLKERLSKRSESNKSGLADFWQAFAQTKNSEKTKQQYITAFRSFCEYCKHSKRNIENLLLADVTDKTIKEWAAFMEKRGNSVATQSIYLRAVRAVIRNAQENNLLASIPKMIIPAGARRTDNFVTVADVIRLKNFIIPDTFTQLEQRHIKTAIDWWLILYCCNGCNAIDLALLKWNDTFFYDNELSFVRSKTKGKGKNETIIKIPLITELVEVMKNYQSEPKKGAFVFPQILCNAKTPPQIDSKIHDFNRFIRHWLTFPSQALETRHITPQFARNSFITTLTHHGISDNFIKKAIGHADNLLGGYQGTYSIKKRLEFNGKLFIDPEQE